MNRTHLLFFKLLENLNINENYLLTDIINESIEDFFKSFLFPSVKILLPDSAKSPVILNLT
jgi:hypothetical protein